MDFVFTEIGDGKLRIVGDFDGLYLSDPDPWGQSGVPGAISAYYTTARARLIAVLASQLLHGRDVSGMRALEVGCGHAHVTNLLHLQFPGLRWEGADVSNVAIHQARSIYPHLRLHHADIAAPTVKLQGPYDIVLLNQMVWYILESMPSVLAVCRRLIPAGGYLVIAHAFLKGEQRYGADIANGYDGVRRLVSKLGRSWLNETYSSLLTDPALLHDDGIIIFRKHQL